MDVPEVSHMWMFQRQVEYKFSRGTLYVDVPEVNYMYIFERYKLYVHVPEVRYMKM